MSVTLSQITTAVDPFNDIPDITFDSIDVSAFTEEVEIYTNTPAVMIPSKLNAMASSMKGWLNDNVSAPLENQQNTFKNEVVVRTNTAMNAVETYMNDEVQGFVNTVFVPWANDAGNVLSNHANLQETNVTSTLAQLQADYTAHVISQDALIAQALADMLANLAQYTTGASNSGYTVHQTNELMSSITMTREIAFSDYLYDYNNDVIFAHEGTNITHHINYKGTDGTVLSFGEIMDIFGEPRPFVQHLRLEISPQDTPSVEKIKAYDLFKNTSAGSVNSFRGTGHEADGEPAEELTILNNQSVPDTDNPELILRRGNEQALMWGGIDPGDYVKIVELDGTTIYNEGMIGNYAQDYDTILFKPFQSYCHDATSGVTGWGVTADYNAVDIDSSGGDHDDPTKCEQYVDSQVALLDDLSRSYEYNIAGESYDSALSDGLIYKVFINDDTGFIDSYAYTVDANGKTGTGAILNAVYDDGVSDVVMTSGGAGYSANTQARAFDLGAVDVTGSSETKAEASFSLKDGMINSITLTDPGAGYTGYWEIMVADGGTGHTHTCQLTQTEVNTVIGGTPIVSTTVDAGHSHDQTIEWNAFNQSFYFSATTGAHTHPLTLTTHVVNPTITAPITTSTGGLAESTVYLKEDDSVDRVIVTDGGADYVPADSVTITGGTPSSTATAEIEVVNGGIAGLAMSTQGTGYTDTTAKTVTVDIQNNVFIPNQISAVVGDSIAFTNLDIQPHSVTHIDGMFDSGDIPQNATFTYVITKPTEITDKYDIHDTNNTSITATLWVRDSSVYVDMNSATGGGFRGIATVNSSGNMTNIAVDRPGQGYQTGSDSVKIVDVSGPGEGAFANVVTDRSIGEVIITSGGSAYSQDTTIAAFDPTGFPTYDESGVLVPNVRTYGSGTIMRPIFSTEFVPGYCTDPAFTDESACTAAFNDWIPDVEIGQLTAVNIVAEGTGYNDIEFILNDPTDAGSGAVLTPDLNNVITDVTFTARGTGYDEPYIVVSDQGGLIGSTTVSVGNGFEGVVVLNNGIGSVTIVNDWQDYVIGEQRVIFVDIDPDPTGYGAEATAMIGGTGNVESITMTNSGTAYKSPLVMVAGPVLLAGSSINNVNTDLALYGPEGNDPASPFSYNGAANTNFKNGIMIQFENPNGHTLNDYWAFKLQTWKLGTPASLLYTSSRYDASLENMRGIITLKDVWEV